jgi:vacuolar-type H+-ATPase subunit F/Vma7
VRVSIEREQGDTTDKRERATSLPRICNGEIHKQSEKRKSRLSDELPPPILAAKSATESEQESSGDYESIEKKCDYDHLKPVVESDTDNTDHQYAELESSVKKIPPKKPPRLSHSREHYYHILESSDESGLFRSAGTSQAGSQMSGMNENVLASSVPGPTIAGLSVSNQLQELFDDPRYAVLFVNQDHLEHIHPDNSEVSRSRSTPSLIAVDVIPFSPTSPERRSLRAVHHNRLSILNSHLVQPQN